VLLACAVAVTTYHLLQFAPIGLAWPLTVALYTCAAAGRLRPALVVIGTLIGLSTLWRLVLEAEPPLRVLDGTLRESALVAVVLLLGDTLHSRRGWAAEREREAGRRLVQQRLRIARDLHDVIGHTLTVVGVQLNVAAEMLRERPDRAADAVRTAREVNREALAELKAAVSVLREESEPTADIAVPAPVPNPGDLDRLVERARAAGLIVEDERAELDPPPSPSVRLTIHRVVQEALTNTLRHAAARRVRISVRGERDGVSVQVVDDGAGPATAAGGAPADGAANDGRGTGLRGMRDRVLALGGEFEAGPDDGGGFVVRAWLPRRGT
jgi:signal transduction histidine kinase